MRIAIHDYSGHAFTVQLSRALAERDHEVCHISSASFTAPRGQLEPTPDDPDCFSSRRVTLDRSIRKSAFVERFRLERRYGRLAAAEVSALQPEVVISANTPLDVQNALLVYCRDNGIPFLFWVQDLIGEATCRILRDRLSLLGAPICWYYRRMEQRLLRSSAHVIGITEDFKPYLEDAGVGQEQLSIIPNWAPPDEIVPVPKQNPWAEKHGLTDRFVFLYSGTLGFKHNPQLLLDLAIHFQSIADVRIVVNSEGDAAEWLKSEAARRNLDNLLVNGFQPFAEMSQVLGSADVLVAILEPDAGIFSVPSKVLTYHCAGRAMLLAVPEQNLAARMVSTNRSGLVCDPADSAAFVENARSFYSGEIDLAEMGQNGRRYASENFDIGQVADRFEAIIRGVSP